MQPSKYVCTLMSKWNRLWDLDSIRNYFFSMATLALPTHGKKFKLLIPFWHMYVRFVVLTRTLLENSATVSGLQLNGHYVVKGIMW